MVTTYHGHVDVISGSFISGWCCARDGSLCSIRVLVNGRLSAEVAAIRPRKDFQRRNLCQDGGAFEADISSFLSFGRNRLEVTDPDGRTLPNGILEIDFRDVLMGDVVHLFADVAHAKIGLHGSPYLASDPHVGSVMGKMLHCLGVQTSDGSHGDEDANLWFTLPHLTKPTGIPRFINHGLFDISKSGIDKIHKQLFGRAVCVTDDEIEPDSHYVVKSEENAAHDGRIKLGSEIVPEDRAASVIQRVIDNRIDDENVHDIRVPVIGTQLPFTYIKRRSIGSRFLNANRTATITATRNSLAETEMEQILRFCREIGLDYGELDVLRDRNTGEIWIVDVNNTPSGPPNGLTKADVIYAIREMALCFHKEFLRPGDFWLSDNRSHATSRVQTH